MHRKQSKSILETHKLPLSLVFFISLNFSLHLAYLFTILLYRYCMPVILFHETIFHESRLFFLEGKLYSKSWGYFLTDLILLFFYYCSPQNSLYISFLKILWVSTYLPVITAASQKRISFHMLSGAQGTKAWKPGICHYPFGLWSLKSSSLPPGEISPWLFKRISSLYYVFG